MNRWVVVDTNVLVSALLKKDSIPARAFDRVCQHYQIATSLACFNELKEVLSRPRLARYFSPFELELFLDIYLENVVFFVPKQSFSICRDEKDNKFLDVAVEVGAACIVSGDSDLLQLHPFLGIPVLSPSDFLDFE
jgi:hypothetical protein